MSDSVRLVPPRVDVRRSYNEAAAELREAYGPDTNWSGTRVGPGVEFTDADLRSEDGFARFVTALHRSADPSVPVGADWVHSTMLWLIDFAPDVPRYLGRLSLRHELNGFLRTEGGHIGYVIRPSAQHRGLGTRMLAMSLPTAAARGIDRALVTCDVENVGSAKVMLANGGVEDVPYRTKRRFWVPTRPVLAAMQPDLQAVMADQLAVLRDWIVELPAAEMDRPSVLAGWTVADLVAHVARSGDATLHLRRTDVAPLPIGRYVSAYAAAAAEIAEGTRALAVATATDRVGGIDASWGAALAVLADLATDSTAGAAGDDPVVLGLRGPILLSEFVATRILELVVHADDLGRSVGRPGPQDPRAVDVVVAALVQIWVDRFPRRPLPPVENDLDWIRQACGRIPPREPVDGLPLM